jgi:hypothetical protein
VHVRPSCSTAACLVQQHPARQAPCLLLQDVELATYVRLVCSVLDIPVHQDPIPSLHCLFSVLLEFRTNPFFRHHLAESGALPPYAASAPASRLQSASAAGTGVLML